MSANAHPGDQRGLPRAAKPGHPEPPETRPEIPATEVIRQPAPRLKTYPGPPQSRVERPAAVPVRNPVEAHAIRPPAATVAVQVVPASVAVKIRKTVAVRRADVAQLGVGAGVHDFIAVGHPVVPLVW